MLYAAAFASAQELSRPDHDCQRCESTRVQALSACSAQVAQVAAVSPANSVLPSASVTRHASSSI